MGFFQEFNESVQDYVLDVIYERKKGKIVPVVRFFMRLFSRVYSWIVNMRIACYRRGIFRTKSLGCMILSIGNITVGGTGKTPAVEMFAKALRKQGRRVAVVSRGYRSSSRFRLKNMMRKWLFLSSRDEQIKVVSDGKKIYLNSSLAGDEPYMLATNLNDVVVVVDKDRVKAGEYAIQKYGIDTIILDDGYQHLALNPRYDVVLIDTTNPFGNYRMLPNGILREPLENLNRAKLFILTKSSQGKDLTRLKDKIRKFNYHAGFIECQYRCIELVDVFDKSKKELSFLKNKRIGLVSAIADPKGFEVAVKELGSHVVLNKKFQDHHRFSVKEIRNILKECTRKNITSLITTEKDAVRFPRLSSTRGISVYFMRVEMEIISGKQEFNNCITQLSFS